MVFSIRPLGGTRQVASSPGGGVLSGHKASGPGGPSAMFSTEEVE